jgi:hypothetical protein
VSQGPDFHAWTHRPKAQGGTDPIDIPGGITWALAYGNDNMVDAGSTYEFILSELYSNDATGYEAFLVGGVFMWIQINEPGYYEMSVSAVHNSSVFSYGNDARLDCSFLSGGVTASITQNMGVADFPGVRFTDADAVIAGHNAPGGLYTRIAFNYEPANPHSDLDFENPLQVSAMLSLAGGPGTIPINTRIFLERISEPGYVTLYP